LTLQYRDDPESLLSWIVPTAGATISVTEREGYEFKADYSIEVKPGSNISGVIEFNDFVLRNL
jgi:hypothetical protein